MIHKRSLLDIVPVALTVVALAFLVYPTFWVFVASLKTPETMFSAATWGLDAPELRAAVRHRVRPQHRQQHDAVRLGVFLSTIVSVNAAYAFSRLRFRGRDALFGAVLMGQTFPWIILVTPVSSCSRAWAC